MKTFKLVAGILCIAFSLLVLFQSCAAGVYNAVAQSGGISGTAGIFVALMLLTGGIVMIATRNTEKKGGAIACVVLFTLAGLVGLAGAGTYVDLNVWSGLCLVLAAVNLIFAVRKKHPDENP